MRLLTSLPLGLARQSVSYRKGGTVLREATLSVLVVLTPFLSGSPLLAQSAWTKTPPLPKACYSEQDTFAGDAEKVRSDLEAHIEKQEQINRGLVDQVFKTDPATLQQRMMAAVQRDPARAQEIMQAIASMGTEQGQAKVAEAGAEKGTFDVKKAKLIADYKAERPRIMSLYGTPQGVDAMGAGGHQRMTDPAVVAENNQKYQAVLCPKWFDKEVPALLASYRTYLVEQVIPKHAAAETEAMRMPEMLGVSTKDFRPIAEMRAVVDYLRFATDLFGLRESGPIKP